MLELQESVYQPLDIGSHINARRSVDKAERSVKHLAQYFGGMRAMNITTDKVNMISL